MKNPPPTKTFLMSLLTPLVCAQKRIMSGGLVDKTEQSVSVKTSGGVKVTPPAGDPTMPMKSHLFGIHLAEAEPIHPIQGVLGFALMGGVFAGWLAPDNDQQFFIQCMGGVLAASVGALISIRDKRSTTKVFS